MLNSTMFCYEMEKMSDKFNANDVDNFDLMIPQLNKVSMI